MKLNCPYPHPKCFLGELSDGLLVSPVRFTRLFIVVGKTLIYSIFDYIYVYICVYVWVWVWVCVFSVILPYKTTQACLRYRMRGSTIA